MKSGSIFGRELRTTLNAEGVGDADVRGVLGLEVGASSISISGVSQQVVLDDVLSVLDTFDMGVE